MPHPLVAVVILPLPWALLVTVVVYTNGWWHKNGYWRSAHPCGAGYHTSTNLRECEHQIIRNIIKSITRECRATLTDTARSQLATRILDRSGADPFTKSVAIANAIHSDGISSP